MIDITVNGVVESIPAGTTIAQMLERMSLADKRLAVEHNGEIVPRGRHAEVQITAGDRVEIVVAVGGG